MAFETLVYNCQTIAQKQQTTSPKEGNGKKSIHFAPKCLDIKQQKTIK